MSNLAIRKKLLATVHIGKAQLHMQDEDYRFMLGRLAQGKTSAADLSERELHAVLDEMKAKGFQSRPTKQKPRPRPALDRTALVGKVNALLADARRPVAYADAMAMHMFKVAAFEWLDADQLWRLVSALSIDAKRHGRSQQKNQGEAR